MDMTSRTRVYHSEAEIEASACWRGPTRTLGLLVKGKNIHEKSLLATDYLNHFNEIIMLLDLISEMPECVEDALEWRPKSYPEHFRDSCFADKDLAILAYESASLAFRAPFDSAVAHMDALIQDGLEAIREAVADGADQRVAATATRVASNLRKFVDVTSAIIHGNEMTMGQADIDRIMTA